MQLTLDFTIGTSINRDLVTPGMCTEIQSMSVSGTSTGDWNQQVSSKVGKRSQTGQLIMIDKGIKL
ncbi:hypothetical protein D3C78_1861760 [compost metagenome]